MLQLHHDQTETTAGYYHNRMCSWDNLFMYKLKLHCVPHSYHYRCTTFLSKTLKKINQGGQNF